MGAKSVAKALVSERALIQRINRKLRQEGEQLRRARGAQAEQAVGAYFVVDLQRNFVAAHDVDIEKFGRELEVLQGWEALEQK